MAGMLELIVAAEEGGHHVVNELFMPPVMFGVVMLVFLVVLVIITWSFRHASASHPESSDVSPYVPYVHPGHAAHD